MISLASNVAGVAANAPSKQVCKCTFHVVVFCTRQVFNNTPDETAFARLWLERESTANAMTMVQPALLSYGLDGPPHPVLLDVSSILVRRQLLGVLWSAAGPVVADAQSSHAAALVLLQVSPGTPAPSAGRGVELLALYIEAAAQQPRQTFSVALPECTLVLDACFLVVVFTGCRPETLKLHLHSIKRVMILEYCASCSPSAASCWMPSSWGVIFPGVSAAEIG